MGLCPRRRRSATRLFSKASSIVLLLFHNQVLSGVLESGCRSDVECTQQDGSVDSSKVVTAGKASQDSTQDTTKDGLPTLMVHSGELNPDGLLPVAEYRALPSQQLRMNVWTVASIAETLGIFNALSRTVATTELLLSQYKATGSLIDSTVVKRNLQERSVVGSPNPSEREEVGTEYRPHLETKVSTIVDAAYYQLEPRDRIFYTKRSDFWEGFECDALFRKPRPIHNESTWTFLRGVYVGVVGVESTLQQSPYGLHGFQKSVIVQQSPGKGRGVFANEFIARGELIWITTQEARFYSGEMYLQFLASVPDDLVCDVMQLTYIQETDASLLERYPDLYSDMMIAVDLDEGGLVNADWETQGKSQNIGFYHNLDDADEEGPWYGSTQHYVALSEIQAGEELLSNYEDVTEDEWRDFGI